MQLQTASTLDLPLLLQSCSPLQHAQFIIQNCREFIGAEVLTASEFLRKAYPVEWTASNDRLHMNCDDDEARSLVYGSSNIVHSRPVGSEGNPSTDADSQHAGTEYYITSP